MCYYLNVLFQDQRVKRIFGHVSDAAIRLLARTSKSYTRKQTIGFLFFLLKAGKFCFQRHSNWREPAFAKRRLFHHTHTYTHTHTTRTGRHQFIHHICMYSTLILRNFTRCCRFDICLTVHH